MKSIGFVGVSILLCLFLVSCQGSASKQAQSDAEIVPQGEERFGQLTRPPVDTVAAFIPQKDSIQISPSTPSAMQTKAKKPSTHPPKVSNEPRRFYVMYPRTFDSLISIEGAVARLHPEDRELYYRRSRSGKLRLPKLDPVTHRPLPFPYSFPDVYKSEIRHLDSIKASQEKRNTPPPATQEPQRFYTMSSRTVDSLVATYGAIARLHPEDSILFRRVYGMGKRPSPILDPKTLRSIPFPYAYPNLYAADIRRLDSIKAAQALPATPPLSRDTLKRTQR